MDFRLINISATDVIQAMTMLVCLVMLPIWWQVGRRDVRFKYLRWLVLVPSLMTITFYITVIFLHWNELNPIEAVFISALLRLYIMSLVLYAGIWILKFVSAGSRHE